LLDSGGDPGDNTPVGTPLGGSTQITPVKPWVVPPITVDTTCKAAADALPVLPPGVPRYGTTGPLGSLTIQQALFNFADNSASQKPPNEMGGVIVQKDDASYTFIPVANQAASQCNYVPVGGYPYITSVGIPVAYVHTHASPGTTVYCPVEFPASPYRVVLPGPSSADWTIAQLVSSITNTNYIVDPHSIYRFGLGPNNQQVEAPRLVRPTQPSACGAYQN
jgi:hypothetical protein